MLLNVSVIILRAISERFGGTLSQVIELKFLIAISHGRRYLRASCVLSQTITLATMKPPSHQVRIIYSHS